MIMEFAVDAQFFIRSSNILVCKELAIVPLLVRDVNPTMFLFSPPCSWNKLLESEKKVNSYVEHNYHHLRWDSGEVPAKDIIKTVQIELGHANVIYCKGLEKQRFLEEILPGRYAHFYYSY